MIGGGKTLGTLLLVAIAALHVCGCTSVRRVFGFEKQLEQRALLGRIEGEVDTSEPADGTLVVLLVRPTENPEESWMGVDTFVRVRPGKFAFAVSPGRYQLGAYLDQNRNGLLDPEEPVIDPEDRPLLELEAGGTRRDDLIIPLSARPERLTEPVDIVGEVARTPREQREFSLWKFSKQGEICEDLDDDAFDSEAGQRGLWEMMDFLTEGIAGVYFLEPYDSGRVPVLFVHGIAGYPQEFSTLFDSLDRERFQAWFYFYPSGFPLGGTGEHLATLLERLQVKHDFDEVAIVAHSMGGLVSRGAIFKYEEATGRQDIGLFISISSPWGGDVNATRAADAPVELPLSFQDMNPGSDYLGGAFYEDEERETRRRLPEHVEYHMALGARLKMEKVVEDDGVITVASQARLQAKEEAQTIRWFDYGHVEILRSPELSRWLDLLLERRFGD